MVTKTHALSAGLIVCLLTGCASTPNSYVPTAGDWKQSVASSLHDPATWVPMLGATAIVVTHSDQRISDSASTNHPVFGSAENATKFSDNGKNALGVLALGSVLLSPQSHPDLSWWEEKGKDLVTAYAAHSVADGTTGALKGWTARERPDGSNNHSFPSGHATSAAASSAIIMLNIEQFEPAPMPRLLMKTAVYTVATGVAWGRVESQKHYPTDVLVGLGLGNFISETVYGAFLHAGFTDAHVLVVPTAGGAQLSVYTAF